MIPDALASRLFETSADELDAFAVEYRSTTAAGEVIHHHVFSPTGDLVAWRSGEATRPELRVLRTWETDQADIEGHPFERSAEVTLELPALGTYVSLVGVPMDGIVSSLSFRGLDLRINLGTPDGPFGEFAMALQANDEPVLRPRSELFDAPDVFVIAPYDELVGWFAGEIPLAHFIHTGRRFGGDVWAISTLEGLMGSAERRPPIAPPVLLRYRDCRSRMKQPVTNENTF